MAICLPLLTTTMVVMPCLSALPGSTLLPEGLISGFSHKSQARPTPLPWPTGLALPATHGTMAVSTTRDSAMCQLLGMNCHPPTDLLFSFEGFHRRGGR